MDIKPTDPDGCFVDPDPGPMPPGCTPAPWPIGGDTDPWPPGGEDTYPFEGYPPGPYGSIAEGIPPDPYRSEIIPPSPSKAA